MSRLYGKRILLIEDQEMMRNQLRQSMTIVGCKHLRVVANIQLALEAIATETFDLILCDYNLGENTNGQQFLEYIRTRELISRNTLFIMITAEQTYQKVMAVAEWTPDDYLLKPFTPAQLNTRVDRLIERQEELQRVNRASDRKRWDLVISECDKLIAAHSKYAFDAMKTKGEALLKSGRGAEARQHYDAVLLQRPLSWARVGLARALEAEGKIEPACALLRDIITESPMVMQAYDLLARLLADSNKHKDALDVLDEAGEISPGTMGRQRTLTTLAIGLGYNELAEKVMCDALNANKYSPVRDVGDYAMLSRALVNQKKSDAALDVVKQARKGFTDSDSNVMLDATECVIYQRAGDNTKATEALARAMASDMTGIPLDIAMSVAEALLAVGRENDALSLIKQAIQNTPNDHNLMQKVQAVLGSDGKGDRAAEIIASSRREIIQLNNEGVRKADAGLFDEAVTLLSAAADRLPNNLQIVGNAALALAQFMVRDGVDSERLNNCLRYRNSLAEQYSEDPKLRQIDSNLHRLKR
ncbi:response regulator [Gammaproteobacteria bacterium LSUCC0112]|nr:response regulator [Gammaproteobacteria bacterium LSUCC0112]